MTVSEKYGKSEIRFKGRRFRLCLAAVLAIVLVVTEILVAAGSVPVSAASQVSYSVKGGKLYFDKSSGTITGADRNIIEAKIPKKISGVFVKGIGKEAFKNCTKLKKVTLPSKLKTIGEGAFYGCSSLEYIDIPSKVKDIGKNAFNCCSSLKGVAFAKKSKAEVHKSAFFNCPELEKVVNCPDCKWGEIIGSLRRAMHYMEDPELVAQQSELWWLQGDAKKEKEIKKLVSKLTKGCKTEREKAEAICIWVVDHIEYETGTGLSYNPWDVYQRILEADKSGKSGKTSCFGYSRLTQILLQAAGIPCITIYQDFREDEQVNHEFNMAYFDGKWRFIDNTDSDWFDTKLDYFDVPLGDMPIYNDHRADMIVYVRKDENEYAFLYGRRQEFPKDKKLNDVKDW
jgi:hypothetical protein